MFRIMVVNKFYQEFKDFKVMVNEMTIESIFLVVTTFDESNVEAGANKKTKIKWTMSDIDMTRKRESVLYVCVCVCVYVCVCVCVCLRERMRE